MAEQFFLPGEIWQDTSGTGEQFELPGVIFVADESLTPPAPPGVSGGQQVIVY